MKHFQSQIKMAILADLDWLMERKVRDGMVDYQIREMLVAEQRACDYGLAVPWRMKKWHGMSLPSMEADEQAISRAASVETSTTGTKIRIKRKES